MWFTIESDLRYLSHRDTARVVERAAGRARLPVRYTQGFNPHPVLSLSCPRPVGVASLADLAVMQLTEPVEAGTVLDALNGQTPRGMKFIRAEVLQAKAPPQARRVDYDAPVRQDEAVTLSQAVETFNRAESWPIERAGGGTSRKPGRVRSIDLKDLVRDLRVQDGRLRFSLVSDGQVWARPGEVLEAVGLDGRADLARLVRTDVLYDL